MSDEISLSQETLRHRLSDIPEKVLPHIKMGFHLLTRTGPENRQRFLDYLLDITARGESLDRDHGIALVGLDSNTFADVLSAVAMVIGATVDNEATAEDFVQFGRGKAFDSVDEDGARDVAVNVIERRQALSSGMSDSSLANSVLPSYEDFVAQVDIRLRFKKDGKTLSGAVPVAVCNLKTDCTADQWFQISANQVNDLIERLQDVALQLESSKKIIERLR